MDEARSWLGVFLEEECGGTGDVLWCPLVESTSVNFRPPGNPGVDPEFGNDFWFHGPPSWIGWFGGFQRFAGLFASPGRFNFANSGHEPTSLDLNLNYPFPVPGTSRDMVASDRITSQVSGGIEGYLDFHADIVIGNSQTRRENNVAYSDGHVQTRNPRITLSFPARWEEYHVHEPADSTNWLY